MPKSPVTAKETAVLRHRAVISSKAVFQNKTNLNAVAKIFRALQAETGAGILASLFFKGIHSISITNLGVLIVETKVNDAVKRNVSGSSATSKSAQNGIISLTPPPLPQGFSLTLLNFCLGFNVFSTLRSAFPLHYMYL